MQFKKLIPAINVIKKLRHFTALVIWLCYILALRCGDRRWIRDCESSSHGTAEPVHQED